MANYLDGLIFKKNIDENGNAFTPKLIEYGVISQNSTMQTKQNIYYRQEVDILSPSGLRKASSVKQCLDNTGYYFVYEDRGEILFSPKSKLQGEGCVIHYHGTGNPSIGDCRVFTALDNNGNVVETIEDVIKDGREVIDKIVEIGGGIAILNELTVTVENAELINEALGPNIVIGGMTNDKLVENIGEGATTNGKLEATITRGDSLNGTLNTAIGRGTSLNDSLEENIDLAIPLAPRLEQAVIDATPIDQRLAQNIQTGTQLDSSLESNIRDGDSLDSSLQANIGTGTILNSNLGAKISYGNTLDGQLDQDIQTGTQVERDLEDAITRGDIPTMKQDILDRQTITDDTLGTTSKTIVGAINEVNNKGTENAPYEYFYAGTHVDEGIKGYTDLPNNWVIARGINDVRVDGTSGELTVTLPSGVGFISEDDFVVTASVRGSNNACCNAYPISPTQIKLYVTTFSANVGFTYKVQWIATGVRIPRI